jgi:predicted amino acid racemase
MKKIIVVGFASVLITALLPIYSAVAEDQGAPMQEVNVGSASSQKQAGQKQAKQKSAGQKTTGQKTSKGATTNKQQVQPSAKPERIWVHDSTFTCIQGSTVIHVSAPASTCPQGFKKK